MWGSLENTFLFLESLGTLKYRKYITTKIIELVFDHYSRPYNWISIIFGKSFIMCIVLSFVQHSSSGPFYGFVRSVFDFAHCLVSLYYIMRFELFGCVYATSVPSACLHFVPSKTGLTYSSPVVSAQLACRIVVPLGSSLNFNT